MIVLTRSDCLRARTVVHQAVVRDTMDAKTAVVLLNTIHDTLERIQSDPVTLVDTRS